MFQADQVFSQSLKLDIDPKRNRILATCWLPSIDPEPPGRAQCIIDTGAKITVIPQRHWQPFKAEIQGIKGEPDDIVQGIGGREIPAKRGLLSFLVLTTSDENATPMWFYDCEVKFAFDADVYKEEKARNLNAPFREIPNVLIGLGGGILQRGGLCINGKTNEAHLVKIE